MKKAVIQSVVLITQKQKKGTPPTARKYWDKSVVALSIYYCKSMLCAYIPIYNRKRAPPIGGTLFYIWTRVWNVHRFHIILFRISYHTLFDISYKW